MAKVTPRPLTWGELQETAERELVMNDDDRLMRLYYEKYDTETWTNSRDDRRRTFFQTAINKRQPLEVRRTAFQKFKALCYEIEYFSRNPEVFALLNE